jgi:restriction endonuclease S subunit
VAKIYFDNHSLDLARAKIFNSLGNEEQINLFDVVELSSGDYLPKSKMEDGKYKVYGGGGLTQSTHTAFNIEFETVGIGRVGARCGCVFIIEKKSWVTDNALFVSNFKKKYDLSFLTHYLNHINLNQFANQSAQPVISQRGIAKCTIPNIDYYKQQEIGVILNAIEKGEDFEDVYNLKTVLEFERNLALLYSELDQQQTYLQLLRQTILQEAVQGKLTNQDPTDEPATELLKRIKAEKEKLIKAGKLKKEKELPPMAEDEIPFELPEGWVWCRWRDLLANEQYSMKRGPFGSSLRKDMFVDKGIRVFEQYNPINNDPYWERYYITKNKYEELKAFTAIAGDLLISCSGATLGRITELPKDVEYGIINQALLKLTLNRNVISNEYFIRLFRSSFIQETILEEAGGSAIPNMVGVSTLKEILIPLPPLAEQQRIVAKVQQLQQQLSLLEAQVQQSKQHAQQLLQSVLKEVFG